jgi:DNA polymerase-3 subunit beta
MKFCISREFLNQATIRIQGVIQERSLAYLVIRASNDQSIEFAAMDRAFAIFSKFTTDVSEPGVVVIQAKMISDIVRELPEGPIIITTLDNFVLIESRVNSEFSMKIPLIADQSWQEPPILEDRKHAEISSVKLAYMIEQVQFCINSESTRTYGTVAFLHRPHGNLCRLVGTDGYRLSYCEIENQLPDEFIKNGIALCKRSLAELHRICKEGYEKVKLSLSSDETTLLAEVPNYQLYMRLTQIKYPSYHAVIPKRSMESVVINRHQLHSIAKRVLLAADKNRSLHLCFNNSALTLNSKNMGNSEGKETLILPDYKGGLYEVAINGKYLMDVFSTMESEILSLQFNATSNEAPLVIEPKEELAECHSKHVLVPIKNH